MEKGINLFYFSKQELIQLKNKQTKKLIKINFYLLFNDAKLNGEFCMTFSWLQLFLLIKYLKAKKQ